MSNLQNINLYAQLEPPDAKPIAILCMLGTWGLVALGYGLFAVYLTLSEADISASLEAAQRQNKSLQQQINLRQQEDQMVDLAPLEAALVSRREHWQRQQLLLKFLEQASMQFDQGFSGAMSALARQHVPGIAIERIALHEGNGRFSMSGQLGSAEALPRYVKRLGQETVFANLTFDRVLMKTIDEVLTFEMTSTLPGEGGIEEPQGQDS